MTTNDWAVKCSLQRLERAKLHAHNSRACSEYAMMVYTDPRGMWKKVMSDAKKCLKACEAEGITEQNPVIQKDGFLYGAYGDGVAPYTEMQ